MSNIYDFPLSTRILRRYVNFAFKQFYSEYIVVGRENIPLGYPLIFAPNHIDALMDALAVHSIAPDNVPVVFLARSDLFKNKLFAKFLNFLKMMPAFRMRDGIENLGKNKEIFERCVQVLHRNKALGIMPEGNQGEERKLRPFSKGIFRIAFAAQQKYGTLPAVKIIPIGIDIGDFVKYGKHIIINIGMPIEVSDYINDFTENSVIAINNIRDQLSSDISNLTLNLATDNHYQCFETAVDIASTTVLKTLNCPNNTFYRFVARQKVTKNLLNIEHTDAVKIEELEFNCAKYSECLQKINLKTWTLEQEPYKTKCIILDGILLFGTSSIFIIGFLLNIVPFTLPVLLRKLMKVKFIGFHRSIQFVFASIFTFPFFYSLQTIFFILLFNPSFWMTFGFLGSQFVFGKWAFQWYREAKRFSAKIRYRKLERNKSILLQQAQIIRKKIIQLIIK